LIKARAFGPGGVTTIFGYFAAGIDGDVLTSLPLIRLRRKIRRDARVSFLE